MSTKISAIYDYVHDLVETTLDVDYVELQNAFDLEDNDELSLIKGWAIVPGPGENTHRLVGCKQSKRRQFGIPLVRLLTATDHDIDRKGDIIKELLEDAHIISNEFEKDSNLGGNTAQELHIGSSQIEYLEGERDKFLVIVVTLSCEFFEDLT